MGKTQGMEAYLEAVYVLEAEGDVVLSSKLADYLGVARPTVTQTVQRMTAQGLVVAGANKEIVLTEEGRERAEAIVRRHRLLERWLSDVLKLDWAEAHVEAGRLEHSISPLVEERLREQLGNPTTCPHGNVIPGSGAKLVLGTPLSDVSAPAHVKVIRIVELAEEDLELLRFLHRSGIVPDALIEITRNPSSFEAGFVVSVEGQTYVLEESVAKRVLVHVVSSEGQTE